MFPPEIIKKVLIEHIVSCANLPLLLMNICFIVLNNCRMFACSGLVEMADTTIPHELPEIGNHSFFFMEPAGGCSVQGLSA
jgi:hypothetical protein